MGEFIDQMKSHDVAMIVSFADTARIEQTFTDNRGLLRRSLAAIQPTQRGTSLGEALRWPPAWPIPGGCPKTPAACPSPTPCPPNC